MQDNFGEFAMNKTFCKMKFCETWNEVCIYELS